MILSLSFYICRESLLTLPEHSVSEFLDTLFTFARVKRDKNVRILSLHRKLNSDSFYHYLIDSKHLITR